MRCRTRVIGVVVVVVAALLTGVAPAGARTDGGPKFIVNCKPSHQLPDDPIMHPGMPGAAHLHQFFGSSATDADSTVAQLEAAPTTCDRSTDTAAYWTPTVYRNGQLVRDLAMIAYYRDVAKNPADVRAYPQGLKMMAGNPAATRPQNLNVAEWSCRQPDGLKGSWFSVPPVCTTGRTLVMKVWFPDCWDGQHLDSADHMSHVAYSHPLGVCPASAPVNIPELAMTVTLDVPVAPGRPKKDGTAGYFDTAISLSSGSVYTLHADFWNSWDQAGLNALVQKCLVQNHPCPSPK